MRFYGWSWNEASLFVVLRRMWKEVAIGRRLEKQERTCRGSYTHRNDEEKVNEGSDIPYGSRKHRKEGSDSLVRLKRVKGKQDLGLEGMDNSTLFQPICLIVHLLFPLTLLYTKKQLFLGRFGRKRVLSTPPMVHCLCWYPFVWKVYSWRWVSWHKAAYEC